MKIFFSIIAMLLIVLASFATLNSYKNKKYKSAMWFAFWLGLTVAFLFEVLFD